MNKKILFAFIFQIIFGLFAVKPAMAGTDLVVNCQNNGPCDITPASTPLFYETGLMPGDTSSQTLTINNQDLDESCSLVLNATDTTPSGLTVNLAERMFSSIYSGGTTYFGAYSGGEATNNQTYQNLYDTSNISLGTLAANSTQVFTWLATFDITAGNEFQRSMSIFDFAINITCGNPSTPATTGGDGGGGDGGSSEPGPASPPVCEAQAPSSAPSLSASVSGANTVTLNWSAVSPVSHYALIFTRASDGESYGSTNIGNTTSYTVTQLSAGETYTFEIFGVNDCAPGDRSNKSTITVTLGSVLPDDVRPIGEGGQVLGATDEEATKEAEVVEKTLGEVAGAAIEVCKDGWIFYIPWVLLVIQFLIVLLGDHLMKRDDKLTKQWVAIGVTLLSIGLFYWLRECQCYSTGHWFLAWLCKWYWVVAIAITLFQRVINYAFIEEIEPKDSDASKSKDSINDTETN